MKCMNCQGKGCDVCHGTGKFYVTGWDESNERYTPEGIINFARTFLGHIDLDPASSEMANRVVKADKFYTFKENGLKQNWYGKVWCNPPFGYAKGSNTGYQEMFTRKGRGEYGKGNIEEAIFLLNGNSLFREWFQDRVSFYPVCFYKGDVHFYKPVPGDFHHGFGTLLLYIGERDADFRSAFSELGMVR